jgi:hypothetical protein
MLQNTLPETCKQFIKAILLHFVLLNALWFIAICTLLIMFSIIEKLLLLSHYACTELCIYHLLLHFTNRILPLAYGFFSLLILIRKTMAFEKIGSKFTALLVVVTLFGIFAYVSHMLFLFLWFGINVGDYDHVM